MVPESNHNLVCVLIIDVPTVYDSRIYPKHTRRENEHIPQEDKAVGGNPNVAVHPISKQLFDIARERGITLPELAELSGWGYCTLSLTRSGKRRMHMQMMQDLADTLKVKIECTPIESS